MVEVFRHTKTYLHLCLHCREDFDAEQKIKNCIVCNKPITEEIYEHRVYPPKSAYTYFHFCKICKIRFDTDTEIENCPDCKLSSSNVGYSISCGRRISFFGWLAKLLP